MLGKDLQEEMKGVVFMSGAICRIGGGGSQGEVLNTLWFKGFTRKYSFNVLCYSNNFKSLI